MLGRGGARGRRRRCEKLHGECCRDLCPALPPSPAFPSANKPPPAQDSDRFSPAILPTLPIAIMMQSLQRAMAHRMHGSKSHCDCPLVLYASSSVPSTPQKLRRQIGQLTQRDGSGSMALDHTLVVVDIRTIDGLLTITLHSRRHAPGPGVAGHRVERRRCRSDF
eukprot:1144163-Rhodomonas_salina.3